MKFIWIDDDPDRKNDADLLEKQIAVEVIFIGVAGKKVDEVLNEEVIENEPDLVILDHSLTNSISLTYKTGSTVATFLHEVWPQCPIISLTGADINKIDTRHKESYEDIFSITQLQSKRNYLYSIAQSIKILRDNKAVTFEDIIPHLKAPEDELQKIKKILPSNLKSNIDDPNSVLEFYRWMKDIFLLRPGFLYDELWAATFIGLTVDGFKTVQDEFTGAIYNGIFADPQKPLWWKSRLIDILNQKIEIVGFPWELGRQLVKDVNLYSKCYASQEEYPETVAAVDDTVNSEWQPMKLKYTIIHPGFEQMLFLEDIRIMNYPI